MTLSHEQKTHFQSIVDTAPSTIQPLAAALLKYMDNRNYDIEQLITEQHVQSLEELFSGPLLEVLTLFSSQERASHIKKLALRFDATIFQTDSLRRSFRSASSVQDHLFQCLQLIEEMLTFEEIGLQDLLAHHSQYEHGTYPNYSSYVLKNENEKVMSFHVFEQLLAEELSLENPIIEEKIESILFDEHRSSFFGHPLIRGIFKSSNSRMHEALGKLLVAAARQEGLRQAIVENIDHGNLDAQLKMMKLIQEHQLTRFSSVIRAVDTWMGLGYSSFENQKITEEVLSLAIQAMEDDHFTEQLLKSERTIDIYVALWATSTKDYTKLELLLADLLKRDKHIQLTTLAFLKNLSKISFTAPFVKELILTTKDIELFAFAWNNFIHANHYINSEYARDNEWEKTLQGFMKENSQLQGIEYPLFEQLEWAKNEMTKDGLSITGKPLSFVFVHLSFEDLISTQIILAHYLQDEELFQRIIARSDAYPPSSRIGLLNIYCLDPITQGQREFLFNSLRDRSSINRSLALKKIHALTPTQEEIAKIEDLLANKSGALRKEAISLLKVQPQDHVLQSAERLIKDNKQLKRLGGLELLLEASKDYNLANEQITALCSLLPKITKNEQVFLEQLVARDVPEYNESNGFGLYTPHAPISYDSITNSSIKMNSEEPWQQLIPLYVQTPTPIEKFFQYDLDKLLFKLEQLIHILDEYADFEYETFQWNDTKMTTTLGQKYSILATKTDSQRHASLDVYPIPEAIVQWIQSSSFSSEDLAYFNFYSHLSEYPAAHDLSEAAHVLIQPFFQYEEIKKYVAQFNSLKYHYTLQQIFSVLSQDIKNISGETTLHTEAVSLLERHTPVFNSFNQAAGIVLQLLHQIPADQWQVNVRDKGYYYYQSTSTIIDLDIIEAFVDRLSNYATYEDYAKMLAINEELTKRMQKENYSPILYDLSLFQYLDAFKAGLLKQDHLYEAIFTNTLASEIFTEPSKLLDRYQSFDDLTDFLAIRNEAIDRILAIELKRGDTPTAVTKLASSISYFEGIDYFLQILQALDGEKLSRGYIWQAETKKDVFSRLLTSCYPKKEETAQQLKEAWQKTEISKERLIEAMMYNQHWIDLVSEVIDWEGLKESAWYFIAHTTDSLSDFAKDQIALFSSITAEDFGDGAFDLAWFQSAYQTLGSKKFKVVYDAAKYASEGANHRRAQLYADTAIGKLSPKPLMKEIQEKRNKDKLRALGLIPLKSADDKDALDRYQFIQQFLKESKQFGAQRRASEARAASIALENLARNAGDGEATRFIWRMELSAFNDIQQLFKAQPIEQITAHLQIEEDATITIIVEKDGKRLKNIPTALKKHADVVTLQEARKDLQEQYKRARPALEQAMALETIFSAEELINLLAHPILAPLLQKLVFISGEHVGMITPEGLQVLSGNVVNLAPTTTLMIAHPYHLLESGQWRQWQAYMFEHKIQQPFKQVFRELYLINADEKGRKQSLRYAGHQVNPSQTVALLKTRGWQISYETGPRKVYYKENIVASLYAQADWFTPAEIEAPTIEGVYFYNRLTGKDIVLDDIPAAIFSEVMRDMDLVVSVAHVGGVDPEASHSTVDMRSIIVEELAKLLKLSNVETKKQHVLIEGKLASYSLHLGSGIVHQVGGSMIPIVAVPSQHRGRIFLPMVDDDPRTAEIMAKLLLLSEDTKIKDPAILAHIRSYEQTH
ncbi:DUF4132 domain-containing protein [Lysinibacillus sphaericus]|uniref:DUF4132 domain-containing protein n=3 Tax=Lysinibacillus TaxID=400634 RepID=B1HT25_LYSSC|nr:MULTISPECIES: DUF4132 domain-containing protein [Lysinibacillus]MBE5086276.1 DUF4132 domain-containing protein [Bacillus thuringiensis]ACA37779.1 conserved hypothetical protein [Lysinibacillus sphaericus C3-41]AMO31984.1 hypothetical protein AR327_05585 [Lysinibacillus sphaericus]AMR88897.1 hypothetical protein A1T07_01085 [Lysinibacillus sphaericus]ANA46968.1 hypothetical protein A2J09_16295 [Lysinibacillus sphaericus]